MSKNRIKLMAAIISCGMFMTGCEMDIKEAQNKFKDKVNLPNLSPETSETGEEYITTENINIFEDITIPYSEVAKPKQEQMETTTPEKSDPINPDEEIQTNSSEEETIAESVAQTESEPPIETEPPVDLTIDDIIVHATTKVNVRSGNTTDSIIIGSLELGESAYKILSCNNNWDLVRTNEKIGFVCRDYLEYSEEIQEDEYEHQIKNDIVLTTSEINMRDKPTSDSKQLNKFRKGTELEVVAEVDNGWLLVKYNGQLGYIKSDYTQSMLEKINELYPELELDDLGIQKIVYSTTTLNIRNGNSIDHEQIGQLEQYESVRVLGEYEDWYLIMTNDYSFGFVSKEYTKDLEDTYVIVDKSKQQLYLYNNDELLYTTPVTTGKDSTPSDTGLFKIYSKETDRYLTDRKTYNAHVNYWMPYNGGEGLHDAAWRSVFGTESYHYGGSHGCINIPPKITETIFDNVKVGTKVLVHK